MLAGRAAEGRALSYKGSVIGGLGKAKFVNFPRLCVAAIVVVKVEVRIAP